MIFWRKYFSKKLMNLSIYMRFIFVKEKISRKLREDALKMYSNGVGMRAISRVLNVPLGCSLGLSVMVGGGMRSLLSCGGRLRSWLRVMLLLRWLMRCGLICLRMLGLFTSGFSPATFTRSWVGSLSGLLCGR